VVGRAKKRLTNGVPEDDEKIITQGRDTLAAVNGREPFLSKNPFVKKPAAGQNRKWEQAHKRNQRHPNRWRRTASIDSHPRKAERRKKGFSVTAKALRLTNLISGSKLTRRKKNL